MASNARGEWSEPAGFHFEIVIPFYKKPWFVFLLATLAILAIYYIRIQRLKQKYRIEKIRLTIARDLHDDVGSTLGSINLLSKTAGRRLQQHSSSEEITPIFDRIGRSAENTLEAMDDIVWSINPDKDTVEDLVIRMREFCIPLLEAAAIDFNFQVEGDHSRPVPMNLRRNCFLVFKEAVNNLLRHAAATRVNILVQRTHQHLLVRIQDNGRGFEPGKPTQRNGLKNMEARMQQSGGSFSIETADTGTTVLISAPVR
jgi:signal transduction histidine kinase